MLELGEKLAPLTKKADHCRRRLILVFHRLGHDLRLGIHGGDVDAGFEAEPGAHRRLDGTVVVPGVRGMRSWKEILVKNDRIGQRKAQCMPDDALTALRRGQAFVPAGPGQAGAAARGISGSPTERAKAVVFMSQTVSLSACHWASVFWNELGSPIEFISDVVVRIPDQQMRITADVEAHGWRIVHVPLNHGVGRNGSVDDVTLTCVSADHDVDFGCGVAMNYIVRNAVQRSA